MSGRPSYGEVAKYGNLLNNVSVAAQEELRQYFSLLDLTNQEAARDSLIAFTRALSDKYGPVAAQYAASWYDDLRARSVDSGYTAIIGSSPPIGSIEASTRSLVGGLWTDSHEDVLGRLTGMVDRYVKQDARNTIMENIANEIAAGTMQSRRRYRTGDSSIGFMRVPTGATTCAWCLMLAGRGPVYWSRETAGEFNRYHDHCDCVVVPAWGGDFGIEGYDYSEYYDMYREARNQTIGKKTEESITATMRKMFDLS